MLSEDYINKMFPKGRLTILGGRPFVGKTSFMLSIARALNASLLYISLREEAFKVVEAIKLQEERRKLLKRGSFCVCDIPGFSVEELESTIKNCFGNVIINYVELMNLVNDRNISYDSRNMELRLIYEQLDDLAQKYNTRIIGVSMLPMFNNPIFPRFEECLTFLDSSFVSQRLIILHRSPEYDFILKSKTSDYVELISKNQNGEEIVDKFSIDRDTQSVIKLLSSKKRQLNVSPIHYKL